MCPVLVNSFRHRNIAGVASIRWKNREGTVYSSPPPPSPPHTCTTHPLRDSCLSPQFDDRFSNFVKLAAVIPSNGPGTLGLSALQREASTEVVSPGSLSKPSPLLMGRGGPLAYRQVKFRLMHSCWFSPPPPTPPLEVKLPSTSSAAL